MTSIVKDQNDIEITSKKKVKIRTNNRKWNWILELFGIVYRMFKDIIKPLNFNKYKQMLKM
jgi:hypothetical protein